MHMEVDVTSLRLHLRNWSSVAHYKSGISSITGYALHVIGGILLGAEL